MGIAAADRGAIMHNVVTVHRSIDLVDSKWGDTVTTVYADVAADATAAELKDAAVEVYAAEMRDAYAGESYKADAVIEAAKAPSIVARLTPGSNRSRF